LGIGGKSAVAGSGGSAAQAPNSLARPSSRFHDINHAIADEAQKVHEVGTSEHVWGWVRAEVTANTCFGTTAKVREKVGAFFRGLADRTDEVTRRCQTILQTQADAFTSAVDAILQPPSHVGPTLALV
jgi:hypothetical protein